MTYVGRVRTAQRVSAIPRSAEPEPACEGHGFDAVRRRSAKRAGKVCMVVLTTLCAPERSCDSQPGVNERSACFNRKYVA